MKMSNVRSVDRRRSKSLIVALIEETGLLSPTDVGAVSCESRPLINMKVSTDSQKGIGHLPAGEATSICRITLSV